MMEAPIPSMEEIKMLLQAVKAGAKGQERRLLRGLVYHGGIHQGLTPQEALVAAVDPYLDECPVEFNIVVA